MNILTIGIILINVLLSIKGFQDATFFNRYKFQIAPIAQKDYIRLLSSGFLHVDTMHLILNMFTLYIFADEVVAGIGSVGFLIVYFGSLLAGNFLSYGYHKKEPLYSAVGASGAVFGILFAAILLNPDMKLILLILPIPIPAYIVGIGYLAYTVFGMKKQLGNIGHAAHLGGAVGGLVLTVLLHPVLLQTRILILVLLAIPILLFLLLGKIS